MAVLAALQFLTRLPIPLRGEVPGDRAGAALPWFPLVGLLIGGGLVGVDHIAGALLAPRLVDALLIAVMVAVTGALHLDGVIDSVDGLLAGPGPADRLATMRESTAGPHGAIAASLLLLASYGALGALPEATRAPALVLAPVLGRAAIVMAYWWYPYGRAEPTLSSSLKRGATTRPVLLCLGVALLFAALLAGPGGLVCCLAAGATAVAIARLALLRLPGITGDICGAICECSQLAVLLVAPLAVRL